MNNLTSFSKRENTFTLMLNKIVIISLTHPNRNRM
jgi:hypothetical protein